MCAIGRRCFMSDREWGAECHGSWRVVYSFKQSGQGRPSGEEGAVFKKKKTEVTIFLKYETCYNWKISVRL